MAIGDLYKTGENSTANAHYAWVRYTDGTKIPSPTIKEKYIKLEKGEKFPPINSQKKGAWWKMTSYA